MSNRSTAFQVAATRERTMRMYDSLPAGWRELARSNALCTVENAHRQGKSLDKTAVSVKRTVRDCDFSDFLAWKAGRRR